MLRSSACISEEAKGEGTSSVCVDDDSGEGLTESQVYEIDADELKDVVSVKGRLRASLNFWKDVLLASPAVLSVIECGYALLLMSEPTPFSGRNQASALQDAEFVDQCIDELSRSSCIRELDAAPVICSPFSVIENNLGKK